MNRMFSKLILPVLLAAFSFCVQAQSEYKFTHYSVNQGLSQSVVNCLFQDSYGFIWVGTQDGLNRFNGYTFERFINNPFDTTSLANNWIFCVSEDADKNIWVGTRSGLHKFDREKGRFERYPHSPDYTSDMYSDAIYGIAIDKEGMVYTNTPPLLNRFDPKTKKLVHFKNSIGFSAGTEDQIFPLKIDRKGRVWIATVDGLSCFNPETQKFKNYQYKAADKNSLSNNFVTSIYEDKRGTIWVGTRLGLNRFDEASQGFTRFLYSSATSGDFVRSIVEDPSGMLWVGTENNGLMKLFIRGEKSQVVDQFKGSPFLSPVNISHAIVLSLIVDRSNNLWVGTLSGADKTDLKAKKFKLYRKSESANSVDLLDNVIAALYKDKDGKLWVGNWGKGLNILDRKTGKVQHFSSSLSGDSRLVNDYVHVIHEYTPNEVWIGTRNGLYVFNGKRFIPYKAFYGLSNFPDFKDNRIYCIARDRQQNTWVGTRNGLYMLSLKGKRSTFYQASGKTEQRISDNLVYSVICDSRGLVWVGTNNGLDCYNPKTNGFTHFTRNTSSKNTLCNNFIVSLCEDSEGYIWIGTKSGVNKLNVKDNAFTYYSEENGFPSNVIYEMLMDKGKNLWFSTGRGLALLRKNESRFRTYTVEDGLQGIEFNHQSRFLAKDGEMFFGGMEGFNSFYPDSLLDNKFVAPVVFTSFEKFSVKGSKSINPNSVSEIVLTDSDYAVTLEFASLDYTNPEKNMYAYKLEPTSDKWMELGSRRFVPLSSLSPGVYNFRVKGTNGDGVWNEEGTGITIRVLPPWYRSTLAIIIYILLISIGIYLVIKIRERNLRIQTETLEIKVAERTAEVEMQKTEILGKNHALENQNAEIEAQRDLLANQHDRISMQKKQITDSIQYARRIQSAVLPSSSVLSNENLDHFVIFRPKDIVSGDFYWFKKTNSHMLMAVVDCTGHGVPGAFMSMLGNSFLNEIAIRREVEKADEVLAEMRSHVLDALTQSGNREETKDGMDMAFCALNLKTLEMQYAGAYIPLHYVRNGILMEVKPDKMPVGFHVVKPHPFTNHLIQMQRGDTIYLLTDGIVDQFGGVTGEKLKMRRIRDIISQNYDLPMDLQKTILEDTLTNWMGDEFNQIDDITMVGIRL